MAVTVFNEFVLEAVKAGHDLNSDALKVALTDTAPLSSNTVFSDISEIAAGNGYTAGGVTATVDALSQSAGSLSLTLSGVSWTASGGAIPAHRYAVLYNSTNDKLIAVHDYGVSSTIPDGSSDSANGTWLGG